MRFFIPKAGATYRLLLPLDPMSDLTFEPRMSSEFTCPRPAFCWLCRMEEEVFFRANERSQFPMPEGAD